MKGGEVNNWEAAARFGLSVFSSFRLPFVDPSVDPSIYPSFRPAVGPSIDLSFVPSVNPFVRPSSFRDLVRPSFVPSLPLL
jgi:hypothetical protein